MWNNDGNDLAFVAYGVKKESGSYGYGFTSDNWPSRYESVEKFLERRMKGKLEGTQVDSLIFNIHDIEPAWELPTTHTQALGPDAVKHVVDFAHQNGMEFMCSIRMNDIHAAVHPGAEHWSAFKRENLHLLQGKFTRAEFDQRVWPWVSGESKEHPLADVLRRRGKSAPDLYSWAAYDYAHPEVRDYFLRVVEGACDRYDLDGIELDWSRHPHFFEWSEQRQNVPIMTDFVSRVRQRVEAYGRKRGRPILLAMHVLDSPAQCLAVGLDTKTWLKEGWVDVLVAGTGFAPFTFPLADWVRLGHERGIPVYGCLEHLGPFAAKAEVIRATAHRYWDGGVDGIYAYNHIYDGLHEMGDPEKLQRVNKLYQIDLDHRITGRYPEEPGFLIHGWMNGTCWPGQLPLAFTTQAGSCSATLSLKIADRPELASRVTVRTQWKPEVDAKRVAWQLNGQPLSNPRPLPPEGKEKEGWNEYETKALRKGDNNLQVTVQPPTGGKREEPFMLQQVRVAIRYS